MKDEIIIEDFVDNGVIELEERMHMPVLENLTIIPSTKEQRFKSKKDGYNEIIVEPVISEELTIIPSTENQVKEGMFNKITVTGEPNLKPEIIKKDEVVFGVKGIAELKGEENATIDNSLVTTSTGSSDNYLLNRMLTSLPEIDATNWVNTIRLFGECKNLTEVSIKNTSNVKDMSSMFSRCRNLLNIPFFDTSNVTSMSNMFYECETITTIPIFDTSNVTNMSTMVRHCTNLVEFPALNTSKVTNMHTMCNYCSNLITVPQLDCSSVYDIGSAFVSCPKIEYMGGLINLGKGYKITTSKYSSYTLSLNYSPNLTHESLMNIINGLYDLNLTYDVANGGTLYTQSLSLGATNMAKLTAEEIAIATNKGWTIS